MILDDFGKWPHLGWVWSSREQGPFPLKSINKCSTTANQFNIITTVWIMLKHHILQRSTSLTLSSWNTLFKNTCILSYLWILDALDTLPKTTHGTKNRNIIFSTLLKLCLEGSNSIENMENTLLDFWFWDALCVVWRTSSRKPTTVLFKVPLMYSTPRNNATTLRENG